MKKYELLVGNVGSVLITDDSKEAEDLYDEYVTLSKDHAGRAAGEPVTLFRDGEPWREYHGDSQDDKIRAHLAINSLAESALARAAFNGVLEYLHFGTSSRDIVERLVEVAKLNGMSELIKQLKED